WLAVSILAGVVCGGGGLLFHLALGIAEELFLNNKPLIFLLPFLGLIIVWLYTTSHMIENKGTNGVFDAVRSGEHVSAFLAPIIFVSTVLTHLGGGSAGREGAALQMGGSLGSTLGRLLHLNQNDLKIITVCGMSATFCGLFGTPLTAAFFVLEVIDVGVFNYSALVACLTSSFTAFFMMRAFKIPPMFLNIVGAPQEYSLFPMASVIILAVGCAAVSILWCIACEKTTPFLKKTFVNPYLRVAVSGITIIILTFIMGTNDYNGSGMRLAQKAVGGEKIFALAFLIKILFTVITLGGGFRGGEIVPTLTIGAAFGSA
ncbi:MAG: chloride channel protein, partial [Oscillospiraceae bacterium]